MTVQILTATELAAWRADPSRPDVLVLDVRETWEVERAALSSCVHIPMSELGTRLGELNPATPLVCLCHHGMRSMRVAMALQSAGFESVYNLDGGIDAWSRSVDTTLPRY